MIGDGRCTSWASRASGRLRSSTALRLRSLQGCLPKSPRRVGRAFLEEEARESWRSACAIYCRRHAATPRRFKADFEQRGLQVNLDSPLHARQNLRPATADRESRLTARARGRAAQVLRRALLPFKKLDKSGLRRVRCAPRGPADEAKAKAKRRMQPSAQAGALRRRAKALSDDNPRSRRGDAAGARSQTAMGQRRGQLFAAKKATRSARAHRAWLRVLRVEDFREATSLRAVEGNRRAQLRAEKAKARPGRGRRGMAKFAGARLDTCSQAAERTRRSAQELASAVAAETASSPARGHVPTLASRDW